MVAVAGDTSFWPAERPGELPLGLPSVPIPVKNWTSLLGWLVFNLPLSIADYGPSFRSLIAYFARRGRDAYSNPFEHHRKQSEWDKQVNNAFLLNLSWETAQQWQGLRDREKILNELRAAARSGYFASLVGTVGELEAQKVRIDIQIGRESERLGSFRVHDDYTQIEQRASVLTTAIHELSNQNVSDRRTLEYYEVVSRPTRQRRMAASRRCSDKPESYSPS
jgi:uncharacterized protein YydD (DUF2326 family)